ncbi:hypothetical protein P154DRAFT_573143 [Amniculicola lignicola CBS 123094]|uniref:Uncharacterized protein n=1 Tax=Amniculicola lignicola CBS 123094 TaxID=1392246 RepID=A0A6A5WNT6_9PLEO|nr:hypothetical protein P154DRAFT_573143 [Amniculicola lignicola CBS 123094]
MPAQSPTEPQPIGVWVKFAEDKVKEFHNNFDRAQADIDWLYDMALPWEDVVDWPLLRQVCYAMVLLWQASLDLTTLGSHPRDVAEDFARQALTEYFANHVDAIEEEAICAVVWSTFWIINLEDALEPLFNLHGVAQMMLEDLMKHQQEDRFGGSLIMVEHPLPNKWKSNFDLKILELLPMRPSGYFEELGEEWEEE